MKLDLTVTALVAIATAFNATWQESKGVLHVVPFPIPSSPVAASLRELSLTYSMASNRAHGGFLA